MEELDLVKDLAVILIAAGFFTLLSKALKQPVILGYIIAGFVVGPHLGLFHLANTATVGEWSEIGIIFLLFALGLEFSFKKLLKVGSGAMIMAGVKCIGMFLVGIPLGMMMGWSMMESVFLGGLLSMSSTTIIIKAFDEMGLKNKPYSPLIFGSLVVEDLIAVLLMVLLSTLAVTGKFEGGKMAFALGKLVFFLVLWFLVGIYVIPTLLKKLKKLLNDETLLILAIGLCFLMVVVADAAGFSSALGAFVMGSILAETLEGERINHLLDNIKNLFGAIFFVSVGMMVDPAVIGEHWGIILIITVVAMAGILISSSAGALIAGAGVDTAVHAGFSLAQLGEFAFIIASLGVSLGVLRDFIYPVIIAVSVITTFTTPYMIKASTPVSNWLQKRLPAKFLERVDAQSTDDYRQETAGEQSHWKSFLKVYFMRIFVYGILLLAIIIGSLEFLDGWVAQLFPQWNESLRNWVEIGVTLIVSLPFQVGLCTSGYKMKGDMEALKKERPSNNWKLFALDTIRILLAATFVIALFSGRVKMTWWSILIILAIATGLYLILRQRFRVNFQIEDQFMANLDAHEEEEDRQSPVTAEVRRNLEKYNVHTESVYLAPESEFAGKTLRELPYRKESSVNIIKIGRGTKAITIPSGDTPVFPYDRLLAVGTEEQLKEFRNVMKGHVTERVPALPDGSAAASDDSDFAIRPVKLCKHSPMTGKTLRQIQMRSHNCMVICYLRDSQLVSNPSPDEPFCSGDLVWLAGEKESLNNLEALIA